MEKYFIEMNDLIEKFNGDEKKIKDEIKNFFRNAFITANKDNALGMWIPMDAELEKWLIDDKQNFLEWIMANQNGRKTMNITKDYKEIENIIWNNKELEKVLDEILIDYEDYVFTGWAYLELINLPRQQRIKKLDEVGAFDFCNGNPMEWAKDYCESAVSDIYAGDNEFDEAELVENLISYCKEYMMHDMFVQCDF